MARDRDDVDLPYAERRRDDEDVGDPRGRLPIEHQLERTIPAAHDGDEGRLSEAAFLHDFAGDLPEKKAKVLYAVQQPFNKMLLAGKTTNAAWRSKPSYYAVSTEDRPINPDLQRFMAKRMGARTLEVKGSHLALISHPDEITRLILDAAAGKA